MLSLLFLSFMIILNQGENMNKGFTLVELLAVIVLLGLLATIAVPSAIGISNSIKKKMYCEKVDMVISDAKRWGDNHLSQLSNDCYKSLTVKDLVNQGITSKEDHEDFYVENPFTGDAMDDNVVGIYLMNNRAYAFFIETNTTLKDACEEEIRVCNTGEEPRQNGQIVCVKRPERAC